MGPGRDEAIRATHTLRPVHLDLRRIAQPVGAWTSILHRVSGVGLIAGTPVLAWMLARSLASPEGYEQVRAIFHAWPARLLALLWLWMLAHHLLAGLRHLLSDVDIGSRLAVARRSAWVVNLAAVAVALLAAGVLW